MNNDERDTTQGAEGRVHRDRALASYDVDTWHLRSTSEKGLIGILEGHFAVFNRQTEINSPFEGHFFEQLAPGAFTKTFQNRNSSMKVLLNHGKDPSVGMKPLGPIRDVGEDKTGAFYEVGMIDTAYNRDIAPGVEAGLYGASFRFACVREEFNPNPKRSDTNPMGIPETTLLEVKVREFGPVTFPAYADATAGLRSLNDEFMAMDLRLFAASDPKGVERFLSSLRTGDDLGHLEAQRATHRDLRDALQQAVQDKFSGNGGKYSKWEVGVHDFDDKNVQARLGEDGLHEMPYTAPDDGPLELGEPTPVRRVTKFVPREANEDDGSTAEELAALEEERAKISTADQNDLPDSDFAYIESGGTKDSEGKTTPRSLRHFPIHDAAHVRNALARASQSPFGEKAMPKILAAAKKFGIDASAEKKKDDDDTTVPTLTPEREQPEGEAPSQEQQQSTPDTPASEAPVYTSRRRSAVARGATLSKRAVPLKTTKNDKEPTWKLS